MTRPCEQRPDPCGCLHVKCDAAGWIHDRVYVEEGDREVAREVVRPCPDCRPDQYEAWEAGQLGRQAPRRHGRARKPTKTGEAT